MVGMLKFKWYNLYFGSFLVLTSCAKTYLDQSADKFPDINSSRWFEYVGNKDLFSYKDSTLTYDICTIERGDLVKILHLREAIVLVSNYDDDNCVGWLIRKELFNFKLTEKRPFKIGWPVATSESLILE